MVWVQTFHSTLKYLRLKINEDDTESRDKYKCKDEEYIFIMVITLAFKKQIKRDIENTDNRRKIKK